MANVFAGDLWSGREEKKRTKLESGAAKDDRSDEPASIQDDRLQAPKNTLPVIVKLAKFRSACVFIT